MHHRVAVTGIGIVSALGVGREAFWHNVLSGCCAIGPVESFDARAFKVNRGAEVRGFRAAEHVRRLDPAGLGRSSQFAVGAARLALDDAGLSETGWDGRRAGVSLGTTSGEPQVVERFDDHCLLGDPHRLGAELASKYPCHVIAGHVAAELQITGPVTVLPAACAAGNYAIAHAYDSVRGGHTDVMLAGGVDSFSRITYTGFARLGAVAPDLCRPFDRNRKGMIPGEGAAVLILERLDAAVARRARVYAEVAGYGLSCDAYHMTGMRPDGVGAAEAMTRALAESGLAPADVSYVSAHGTGTPTNDRLETAAIKRALGESAYRVPVSSVKSMLGHAMGAAAAIEAAVCALAAFHDRVPPTIHLEDPDPECDLDYVPNTQRALRVDVALNNAYGFGGSNSSVVFTKRGAR